MLKTTRLTAPLLGLCLLISSALAEKPVNDKLPDPDGKPADMTKPVMVFIIMGQSNTLEYGVIDKKEPVLKMKEGMSEQEHAKAKQKHQQRLAKYEQDKGKTLVSAIENDGLYPFIVDDAGEWTKREDVRVAHVMQSKGSMKMQRNDWLTVKGKGIGIDQGIGHHLGNHFDGPVLIIRSSIGNRGLGWDLLPPGSPPWEFEEKDRKTGNVRTMVYAGYQQSPKKWEKGTAPERIKWYAGKQYDDDTANAKKVLAEIGTYYPGATEYKVAGFFWWQGCKDRNNPAYFNRYEKHLGFLIDALRKDFNAPNAKFVAASLGEDEKGAKNGGGKILEAIMNIADASKHPEYTGTVAGVYTHPLTIPAGGSCGHYGGSAKTYMNVGLGMGEAMVELFKNDK